jgi:hypothetical protein
MQDVRRQAMHEGINHSSNGYGESQNQNETQPNAIFTFHNPASLRLLSYFRQSRNKSETA